MGFANHVDIVGTVADTKRDSLSMLISDHGNQLGLLLWRDTAGEDDFSGVGQTDEFLQKLIVGEYLQKRLTTDDDSHLSCRVSREISFVFRVTNLLIDLDGASPVNDWLQEIVVEELARVANVDGSLNLVTC